MPEQRHLHAVPLAPGEVVPDCAGCIARQDEIDGLKREVSTLAGKLTKAKRDKEAEARRHEFWPYAVELFAYWKERCNHPRSDFGLDRFDAVLPFLKSKGYGKCVEDRVRLCQRAIEGAAFDPYVTRRKNGSTKKHDDWMLIFRDRDKFEEFCNKAPRDWQAVA